MSRRYKPTYSRLHRKQGKKYARQTALFTLLTIAVLVVVILKGIPALVKVAVFFGDMRSSTQPIAGTDDVPPPPPTLLPIADATFSASIRVSGYAEEGATVVLYINGRKTSETIVENNGEWLFNSVPLESGVNNLSAYAVDLAGNKSGSSKSYSVVQDNEAPLLEVSSPREGNKYYGESEKNISLSGQAEPGSVVHVNLNLVIVAADGSFTHKLSLQDGENLIRVTARDKAGNETTLEIKVNYEEYK